VCIEAVLDTMAHTEVQILHIGVGNSKLAQRFASRVQGIEGLTVHPNEKIFADSLAIPNYTIHMLNKYSRQVLSVLSYTYDFIIDNNLASFACCKTHFFVMIENYLSVLRSRGRILTCQIGMDAYHDELGCSMTYTDLVGLESQFPVLVSKLNDVVYALTLRS